MKLSRARAMTLVELLAALSLLSMFVAAAGAWTQAVFRGQARLAAWDSSRTPIDRVLAAIRSDLDQAAESDFDDRAPTSVAGRRIWFDAERGVVRVITAQARASHDEAGWREVEWRRTEAGRLVRADRSPEPSAGRAWRERLALDAPASISIDPVVREDTNAGAARSAPGSEPSPVGWTIAIEPDEGEPRELFWRPWP